MCRGRLRVTQYLPHPDSGHACKTINLSNSSHTKERLINMVWSVLVNTGGRCRPNLNNIQSRGDDVDVVMQLSQRKDSH